MDTRKSCRSVLLAIFVLQFYHGTSCSDPGWIRGPSNQCFHASNRKGKGLNLCECLTYCENLNASLACVPDESVNDWLVKRWNFRFVWLPPYGTNLKGFGQVCGNDYPRRAAGDTTIVTQNCAVLATATGKWWDATCRDEYVDCVCERRPGAAQATRSGCLDAMDGGTRATTFASLGTAACIVVYAVLKLVVLCHAAPYERDRTAILNSALCKFGPLVLNTLIFFSELWFRMNVAWRGPESLWPYAIGPYLLQLIVYSSILWGTGLRFDPTADGILKLKCKRRLAKRRTTEVAGNFCLGILADFFVAICILGIVFFVQAGSPTWIMVAEVLSVGLIFGLALLRGVALSTFSVPAFVVLCIAATDDSSLYLSYHVWYVGTGVVGLLVVLPSSMVGNARDRRVVFGIWLSYAIGMWTGIWLTQLDNWIRTGVPDTEAFVRGALLSLFGVILPAHLQTWYMRSLRPLPEWSAGVRFLKLSRLRRSAHASKDWILKRQQDMEPEFFGDVTKAICVIVVSHAWMSPTHADPDGLHIREVIKAVDRDLFPFRSCGGFGAFFLNMYNLWRRYYFLYADDDVLLFFDFASLSQAPRNEIHEKNFKVALAHMSSLYNIFPVLVIDSIPADVEICGHHLEYVEKGWCWTELNIAAMGGRLDLLSSKQLRDHANEIWSDSCRRSSKEMKMTNSSFSLKRCLACMARSSSSWGRARRFAKGSRSEPEDLIARLSGWPSPEAELYDKKELEHLLKYRDTQTTKCKVFTCGKHDFKVVKRQLLLYKNKDALHDAVHAGDSNKVDDLVAGFKEAMHDASIKKKHDEKDDSMHALVNGELDSEYSTLLHVAVSRGNTELVRRLRDLGAKPARDARGNFPWEIAGMPRFSAAATASRQRQRSADASAPIVIGCESPQDCADASAPNVTDKETPDCTDPGSVPASHVKLDMLSSFTVPQSSFTQDQANCTNHDVKTIGSLEGRNVGA